MPGPIFVPGARNTSRPPPPKPVTRAQVQPVNQPEAPAYLVPPQVTGSWAAFWHALDSNLPWYINHCRASRRALRGMAKAHG